MGGNRHALVLKAKLSVKVQKPILAGQYDAAAVFGLRLCDDRPHDLGGVALSAMIGCGDYGEDHLPRSVGVVQFRVVIQIVRQIPLVGDHAVDKGQNFPIVL